MLVLDLLAGVGNIAVPGPAQPCAFCLLCPGVLRQYRVWQFRGCCRQPGRFLVRTRA
jgi:hypothetical protein